MPTTIEVQGAQLMQEVLPAMIQTASSNSDMFKVFPIKNQDSWLLVYERKQLRVGLQGARGDGGPTTAVPKTGRDQYSFEPGMYGDHYVITEAEINRLRKAGSTISVETLSDQMSDGTDYLAMRHFNRIKANIASVLTTGAFTAVDAAGRTMVREVFPIRAFTAQTPYSDYANSTPYKHLTETVAKLELGISANFANGSILCSRPTANLLLNNANNADLRGIRRDMGATANNLDDLNDLLKLRGLPTIQVIDDGYYPGVNGKPSSGIPTNFTRFLTNGKMVLVGQRPDGATIGEYRLCPAAQNGTDEDGNTKPGEWYTIEDNTQRSPWNVILRMGHNGGPVPFMGEGIAVITVAPSNDSAFS